MPVDPAFELRGLRPGVGVEKPVGVYRDARLGQTPPKRFSLCPKEQAIPRDGMRMLGESVCRLVDTHYPLIRVFFGQQGRAHARAAEGVKNERPWLHLITCQQLLEGDLRVLWAGFSPEILLVMLDDPNQISMRRHLIGS